MRIKPVYVVQAENRTGGRGLFYSLIWKKSLQLTGKLDHLWLWVFLCDLSKCDSFRTHI